jgi:uncharacterized membrane protein YbhN (UPF0104 family)
MKFQKYKRLLPLLGIVFFAIAATTLYHELRHERLQAILENIEQMPAHKMALAFLLTFLSYLVMTGYDVLALRYVGRRLSYARIAFAGSIGYAFSNAIGLSMLAGASVRYWIYSTWGLSAMEITRVVLFCSLSLWLGFFVLSGIIFLASPLTFPVELHLPFTTTRPVGFLLLLLVVAYFALIQRHRRFGMFTGRSLALPSMKLAGGQIGVAMVDWLAAGMVLFALLPQPWPMSFTGFLQIYLLAQLGGLISQVPGGLGVFESLMVMLTPATLPVAPLLGALVVFRGIYYLMPLMLAAAALGIAELVKHRGS